MKTHKTIIGEIGLIENTEQRLKEIEEEIFKCINPDEGYVSCEHCFRLRKEKQGILLGITETINHYKSSLLKKLEDKKFCLCRSEPVDNCEYKIVKWSDIEEVLK